MKTAAPDESLRRVLFLCRKAFGCRKTHLQLVYIHTIYALSLLILDEPMNGLDKNGVISIRNLLLSLKSQGKTIILASHFAQDIDELCDTVCEMDQGILTLVRNDADV